LRGIVQAAVAANIRDQEKKENIAFYTIGLTEIDTREIEKLRAVIPYLRNSRPICKAIWEYYYRNLTTDLVNRIVGAGTHTGIYKITCLLDNKIYIGQARDISDRWKTHIKCGLGIDTPSNKLYTAMLKEGVENFSFEVIEECSVSDLNKKEKYWIDYFQSNIYGYNMTAGGARS
jgi:predicted GIY-YIG superfamily endonuclease